MKSFAVFLIQESPTFWANMAARLRGGAATTRTKIAIAKGLEATKGQLSAMDALGRHIKEVANLANLHGAPVNSSLAGVLLLTKKLSLSC